MKKYALLVGVSRYDDPEIGNLSFAADDAREVGTCLREVCGFDEVRTLVSGGEREPDHISVVKALHSFAPILNKDDLFLFYFAGHGIHTANGSYLLASNSLIRMPELAAVPMPLLQQCLSRLDAAERVLILDACRNDPHQGRGDSDNLLTQEFSRDILAVAKAPWEGVSPATCVLFSCSEGERAYEWPDKRHGAFTWYLLDGMRGAAVDPQGRLTIQSLSRFVEEHVPRWSRKVGMPRTQTPWAQQVGSLREICLGALSSIEPKRASAAATGETLLNAVKDAEELKKGIQFDAKQCARAILRGTGSKEYVAEVANSRLPDWRRGADLGWAEAQTLLGVCHYYGFVVERDLSAAFNWFREAALQGYTMAQNNLGICCRDGAGVDVDLSKAVRSFEDAARQGDAKAQYNLGFSYWEGTGVIKDEEQAFKWFKRSAEKGYLIAQARLSFCYKYGRGVQMNRREAKNWRNKVIEDMPVDSLWWITGVPVFVYGIAPLAVFWASGIITYSYLGLSRVVSSMVTLVLSAACVVYVSFSDHLSGNVVCYLLLQSYSTSWIE